MTVQTIAPHGHRRSAPIRHVVLAVVGLGLAMGAGVGANALLTGEGATIAPAQEVPPVVVPDAVRDPWQLKIGTGADGRPPVESGPRAGDGGNLGPRKLETLR